MWSLWPFEFILHGVNVQSVTDVLTSAQVGCCMVLYGFIIYMFYCLWLVCVFVHSFFLLKLDDFLAKFSLPMSPQPPSAKPMTVWWQRWETWRWPIFFSAMLGMLAQRWLIPWYGHVNERLRSDHCKIVIYSDIFYDQCVFWCYRWFSWQIFYAINSVFCSHVRWFYSRLQWSRVAIRRPS